MAKANANTNNHVSSSDRQGEIAKAAGNACLGLAQAIEALARAGAIDQAKDLADELKWLTKSISWKLKGSTTPVAEGESSEAETWLGGLLEENGGMLARDILELGAAAGIDKGAIFQARQSLGLEIKKVADLQKWTLPPNRDAQAAVAEIADRVEASASKASNGKA